VLLARARRRLRDPNDELVRGIRPYLDGILLRVAFIDALIAERPAAQVVILGAGLDTRAWRLRVLHDVRVFEVDHPATQTYKQRHARALGPPLADLRYVPVDFTRDALDSALAVAGHDARAPTLWIWEGVIMYLQDAALRSTLRTVHQLSAAQSSLIAHYHEPGAAGPNTWGALQRKLVLGLLGEPQLGLRDRSVMKRELTDARFQVLLDAGVREQAQRVGGDAPDKPETRVSRIALATPV
jgi:methyltransferase (TIGR00027 family)